MVSRKFLEKQVSKHEEETTIKIKERKKQPGSKGSFNEKKRKRSLKFNLQ